MEWLRTIRGVLFEEPETWLAYLHGQQFDRLEHLKEVKPRFRGTFSRVLAFAYWVIRRTRVHRSPIDLGQHTVLAYAGTKNQADSLRETVRALESMGVSVLALAEPSLSRKGEGGDRFERLRFGPIDVAKTIWLLLTRVPLLYRSLIGKSPLLRTRWFDTFCRSYVYLAYFEHVLRDVQPQIVLVSNDHNVGNRALVALARYKGVKTAYLQHASVSTLFPALGFDYSFLDGLAAESVYQQCEQNRPPEAVWPKQRHIFLSGQKKRLSISRQDAAKARVGLALNKLDRPDDVAALIQALSNVGCRLRVRWHPGMGGRSLESLRKVLHAFPQVAQSDPEHESVGQFLEQIDVLIAGNSSIHLEAALAGVVPIHFELSASAPVDYYGYVEHGLSCHARSLGELIDLVSRAADKQVTLNSAAIRYYSATFDTPWHGREGELVAKHILELIKGSPPSSLWGISDLAQSSSG